LQTVSEITEKRFKCNLCGNVSPVFDPLQQESMPTGWRVIHRGFLDNNREGVYIVEALHFCTKAHETEWRKGAEELTE
jgi:hypothetical protein